MTDSEFPPAPPAARVLMLNERGGRLRAADHVRGTRAELVAKVQALKWKCVLGHHQGTVYFVHEHTRLPLSQEDLEYNLGELRPAAIAFEPIHVDELCSRMVVAEGKQMELATSNAHLEARLRKEQAWSKWCLRVGTAGAMMALVLAACVVMGWTL